MPAPAGYSQEGKWEMQHNWSEELSTLTDNESNVSMMARFQNLGQEACMVYNYQNMLLKAASTEATTPSCDGSS